MKLGLQAKVTESLYLLPVHARHLVIRYKPVSPTVAAGYVHAV